MGGKLKALLPFQHHTFIDEILAQIAEIPLEEIVIVTGYESHKVREHFSGRKLDPKIKISNNSLYVTGLFRSIKSGLKGLSKPTHAVMIILADQPQISKTTYQKIHQDFISSSGNTLWRAFHQHKAGHPTIIGAEHFKEILTRIPSPAERDRGCQFLFQRAAQTNSREIREIHLDDPGITNDFDTESDISKLN